MEYLQLTARNRIGNVSLEECGEVLPSGFI